MRRRHAAELLFDLEPHGHRIDADVLAGQAREEELRPYLLSSKDRKAFGTLSRPLSSMRAGALPLNTRSYSTFVHKIPPDSRRGSGGCQPQISNPSVSYAKFSPFHRPIQQLAQDSGLAGARPTRVLPCGASFHFMLRAALIGFSSSGKTTLFQLMTSVRETARGTRQGRDARRHFEGARRAPRSADGDVQPEEAGPGHRRVLGHGGHGPDGRRADARRRRRLQERRRARPRAPRVSGSGGRPIPPGRSIRRATRRRWKTS